MPYTYVAAGTISTATTAAPGQPAGKAAGDLLLMLTACFAPTEALNAAPTGWTPIEDGAGYTKEQIALFGRIATDDANDNVSHDFWDGSSVTACQIACFSGSVYTDLSTIVAHTAVTGDTGNVDIVSPALTITTPHTLVIGCAHKEKSTSSDGTTVTSPTGLSNRIGYNAPNGANIIFVWDYTIQTTASSISASVWNQSVDESDSDQSSFIVSLKMAGGPKLWWLNK